MWKDKYQVVKIVPGVVVMPGIGRIDLSSDRIPEETIQRMYDAGCPYLKLKEQREPQIEIPEKEYVPIVKKDITSEEITVSELIILISNCATAEVARKYADMRPDTKSVQKAYNRKLQELNNDDLP